LQRLHCRRAGLAPLQVLGEALDFFEGELAG
jgi:hypothetical protein